MSKKKQGDYIELTDVSDSAKNETTSIHDIDTVEIDKLISFYQEDENDTELVNETDYTDISTDNSINTPIYSSHHSSSSEKRNYDRETVLLRLKEYKAKQRRDKPKVHSHEINNNTKSHGKIISKAVSVGYCTVSPLCVILWLLIPTITYVTLSSTLVIGLGYGFMQRELNMPSTKILCPPSFKNASGFALLAKGCIECDSPSSYIVGNIGTVIGSICNSNLQLVGTKQQGTLLASNALNDALAVYNYIGGLSGSSIPSNIGLGSGGPSVFTPGVYISNSALNIKGNVTLNGMGNPDSLFFFIAKTTLNTKPNIHINLVNQTQACNVYWRTGNNQNMNWDHNNVLAGNFFSGRDFKADSGTVVIGKVFSMNRDIEVEGINITNTVCDTCNGGACCLPSGSCSIRGSYNCSMENGTFVGVNTTCTVNRCVKPIIPIVNCTVNNGTHCITYWNYNNTNTINVTIPIGPNNQLKPNTLVGQNTMFRVGLNKGFTMIWNCSLGQVSWNITTGF